MGVGLRITCPGSSSGTAWVTDQRVHARGWAGGSAARSWVSWIRNGTREVVSIRHGGSWANPVDYEAGLSGATHALATLSSGHQSASAVASAVASAAVSLGAGAFASGAVVTIPGASSFLTGSARALGATGTGRIGCRRAFFGTDAEQGSVTHTGWIYQRLTAPANGRITSVGVHGVSGYQPRLIVARGGTFASPGNFTDIRYGDLSVGLTSHGAGVVTFEALEVTAGEAIWLGAYSNGVGGMSRRAHTATPAGQFDWTLNEAYRTDTTSASSEVEDGSWTPANTATANFYTTLYCTFEDEANGYQGNGLFAPTWLGPNRDATSNSPSTLVPSAANDTFRHTVLPLASARLNQFRMANGTLSGLDGMLCWVYEFNDWVEPTATTNPLLGRGTMTPSSANAYNTGTFDSPIEVGEDTLGTAAVIAYGNCWGRLAGGGAPTGTQILFDSPTGGSTESLYLNHWPLAANLDVWSDAILDPHGLLYTNNASESQYYQDQAGNMPMNVANATLPANYDPGTTDRLFGSVARFSVSVLPTDAAYAATSYRTRCSPVSTLCSSG